MKEMRPGDAPADANDVIADHLRMIRMYTGIAVFVLLAILAVLLLVAIGDWSFGVELDEIG